MGSSVRILAFFSFISLLTANGQAQHLNLPLHRMMNLEWENEFSSRDSFTLHTSMRPVTENRTLSYKQFQQYHSTKVKKHFAWLFADKNWIKRKSKWENLYDAEGKDFYFDVNPVFNFEYGRDLANNNIKKMYKNTRGFLINGNITDKVSFSTSFYENQAMLPRYLSEYAASIGPERLISNTWRKEDAVMPGQGRTKPFKTTGYDYAWAQGYVSYSPSEKVNLQFGHGKLFVGEGYRSMLLSDNAFNFPHLRATSYWWKNRIQYSVIFASMQSLRRLDIFTTTEPMFERKAASFHYINIQLAKNVQVGLFEGTIWKRMNENQELLPMDFSMFNPVLGINTIRFGMDNDNNTLVGINAKVQPMKKIYFYAQLAIDDLSGKKLGWQLGGKWFDPLGFDDASLQIEYNQASAYTYQSANRLNSYTHYNQPLAHSVGGGFTELLAIGNYRIDDYFFEYKFSWFQYKLYNQSGIRYDSNVLISDEAVPDPDDGYTWAQSWYNEAAFGYIINPLYNMNLMVGWLHRGYYNVPEHHQTSYIYIGFRTSLSNFYYDI